MIDPARRRATLIGVAAIALWSALAVLTVAAGAIPPFQLLASTFVVGGLTGLALLLRPGGAGLGALRQPLPAFALAVVALFGYHALYFVALQTAPAVEANLINYLWPLLIVLLAGFVPGERPRPLHYLGTLLGLAGAVLIVTRGERLGLRGEHLGGYAAALGAALTWSSYSVLNRRFGAVPSSAITGACLAVAALAAAAHALFERWAEPAPSQWLAIAAMGIGPVGAAFWFWDIGTKRGELALLGTLSYAAPLLSTGWLLLAGLAPPHWSQAAACALLVAGGLLSVHAASKVMKEPRSSRP